MQRLDYATRERISTGRGPMNLDAGRLLVREAVRVVALDIMALIGASVFASIFLLSAYAAANTTGVLRGVCIVLALAFFAVSLLICGGAGALTAHCIQDWRDYQGRLKAWHLAELEAYRAAGGAQVDRQLSVKALTIAEPGHVLWVALALAEKIRNGQAEEPSVAALAGDVWVGRVKVGELSRTQAEDFARALAQVGVIKGRRPGKAGQLATTNPAELIDLVTTRAGRIKSEQREENP